VRDLRYRFSEIESLLEKGEEIQITKRKRAVARLLPIQPEPAKSRPDFLARLRSIYGRKRLKVTGAELLAFERDRF